MKRTVGWEQTPPHFDDYRPECVAKSSMVPLQQAVPPKALTTPESKPKTPSTVSRTQRSGRASGLVVDSMAWRAGEDDGAESDASEVSVGSVDAKAAAADETAAKIRKRAGLPEVDADTLASSIANKMLTLGKQANWSLETGFKELPDEEGEVSPESRGNVRGC